MRPMKSPSHQTHEHTKEGAVSPPVRWITPSEGTDHASRRRMPSFAIIEGRQRL